MTRGGAGSVYLYRRQPEVVAEPRCSGTIECALIGVADHLLLLVWLLLMIVVALGSLVFLPRARSLCDQELRRTRAEYDAFDRFIDRARGITPSTDATEVPMGGQAPLIQRQSAASNGSLDVLVAAYEDTVMGVPHFEEEYNETVADHMREELSDEIAEAVQAEAPDHTPEALDAVWEEEAVRFSAESDQDCALQSAEGRRLAERKQGVQSDAVRILSPEAVPQVKGR